MARVKKEVTFEAKLVYQGVTFLTLKDVAKDLSYKTQRAFVEAHGDIVHKIDGVAGKWVSVDDYNELKGAKVEEVTPVAGKVTTDDVAVEITANDDGGNYGERKYEATYKVKIKGITMLEFDYTDLEDVKPVKIARMALKTARELGYIMTNKVDLYLFDLLYDINNFNHQGSGCDRREIDKLKATNKALEEAIMMERYTRIMGDSKGSYSTNGKLSKVSNKSQYRVLAKVCHPDNCNDDGKAFKVLEEIFA